MEIPKDSGAGKLISDLHERIQPLRPGPENLPRTAEQYKELPGYPRMYLAQEIIAEHADVSSYVTDFNEPPSAENCLRVNIDLPKEGGSLEARLGYIDPGTITDKSFIRENDIVFPGIVIWAKFTDPHYKETTEFSRIGSLDYYFPDNTQPQFKESSIWVRTEDDTNGKIFDPEAQYLVEIVDLACCDVIEGANRKQQQLGAMVRTGIGS
jgi:hypothetical protein